MYRDYIFDFYGTLVDIRTDEEKDSLWKTLVKEYHQEGVATTSQQLRLEYQKFVKQEIARCTIGNREPEIALERVMAALFHRDDVTENSPLVWRFGARFRELSIEYLYPYPGVQELLASLREKGGRVWLLSNAQRIFTESEIARVGLKDFFDGIYISSAYGVKKPDPAFFQILLKEQEIDPSQAIMIGNDMNCDIRGAKKVGLHTLYMKTATSPDLDPADAEIAISEPDMDHVRRIVSV